MFTSQITVFRYFSPSSSTLIRWNATIPQTPQITNREHLRFDQTLTRINETRETFVLHPKTWQTVKVDGNPIPAIGSARKSTRGAPERWSSMSRPCSKRKHQARGLHLSRLFKTTSILIRPLCQGGEDEPQRKFSLRNASTGILLDEHVYVSVYPLFSSVSVPINSVSCLVKVV